jgi:hypothetical protein
MNSNEALPRRAFCEWALSVKADKNKFSEKRRKRENDNIPSK